MKSSYAFRALLIAAFAAACTPIAPSVHKSVLRPGAPEKVRPSPVPASQDLQRITPERKEGALKVTWVRDDEQLEQELGSIPQLKRASDEEVAELKTLSDSRIMVLPLGEDGLFQDQEVRVVIRVQMASARLEEVRAQEEAAWNFWVHDSRKAIAASQALDKSQLGGAIVNVYVVGEKPEKSEKAER
jgi:hypothetical protein